MQISKTTAQTDTCKVTTTWFGFYRVRKGSNEIFDTVDLLLPKYSYESQVIIDADLQLCKIPTFDCPIRFRHHFKQ